MELIIRPNTTDARVYDMVYREGQYAMLSHLTPTLVMDLGAYTGITTRWFLETWPACYVLAVEPDPGNFATLRQNIAGYEHRVTLRQQAVWSHPCMMRRVNPDSDAWSCRYVEDEHGDVQGVTVATLTDRYIDVLKLDVEGAEAMILPTLDPNGVGVVAAELHDRYADATAAWAGFIGRSNALVEYRGEVAVAYVNGRHYAPGAE